MRFPQQLNQLVQRGLIRRPTLSHDEFDLRYLKMKTKRKSQEEEERERRLKGGWHKLALARLKDLS